MSPTKTYKRRPRLNLNEFIPGSSGINHCSSGQRSLWDVKVWKAKGGSFFRQKGPNRPQTGKLTEHLLLFVYRHLEFHLYVSLYNFILKNRDKQLHWMEVGAVHNIWMGILRFTIALFRKIISKILCCNFAFLALILAFENGLLLDSDKSRRKKDLRQRATKNLIPTFKKIICLLFIDIQYLYTKNTVILN